MVSNEWWGTLSPSLVSGGGAGWFLVVGLAGLWCWGPVLFGPWSVAVVLPSLWSMVVGLGSGL